MRYLRCFIIFVFISGFVSGCWVKGRSDSGLRFKRITPGMMSQMDRLIDLGCDNEVEYFNRDVAMLYSILPGGGQFYTGETQKGFMYMFSSPFIIPYIVSFQDAQNSVDYYNFRYTIHFCSKKLKISKRTKPRENEIVIGETVH